MNRNRILSPVLAAALMAPMSLPVLAQSSEADVDSPAVEGTMEADTVGVDGEMSTSGDTASGDMSSDSSGDSSDSSGDTMSDSSDSSASDGSDGMTAEADALIVTVGDAEITASDVQAAIEAFPPQLAQQVPPEQLVSVAVDQLVLRELILQRAEDENLSEDPEVQQMVEDNTERTEEDAIVQVYVQRALEEAVTDEAVQSAYDDAASQTEQELPAIDQVRPQIEQQLRQERLGELRQELMDQGTEITFYDENGEPVDDAAGAMSNGDMSGDASESSSDTSGSDDGASASDDMSGDMDAETGETEED